MAATTSLSLSQAEEEEEQAIASDTGEEEEEEEQHGEAAVSTQRCVPRRPRRVTAAHGMAARQRVQRVVVLAGPGQPHVRSLGSTDEVFMTHLPDSPPRGILSRPTIFQFADTRWRAPPRSPQSAPPSTPAQQFQTEEAAEEEEGEELMEPAKEEEDQRPEVDESFEEQEDGEGETGEASCGGPHAVDILSSSITLGAVARDEEAHEDQEEEEVQEEEEEGPSTSEDDTEGEEEAEEQAYRELQAARARIQAEQHERDALREELSSYVASLAAKCDADGERLVAFPRNFQQIVSLMTSRDIATDAPTSSSSSTAAMDPKSWSQILIQNSLAKQHAFGTLDESEDAVDGEGSLAAKIALKMARIRQLDAILEEKLGKNLYASAAAVTTMTKKATKHVNPQEPEVVTPATTATTRRSVSTGGGRGVKEPPSSMNFIERNRQVVENGATAHLTRDEAQRVKWLLRGTTPRKPHDSPDTVETVIAEPVEFRLEQEEQQQIEQLLADKRGVYASAVLMALDDVAEEDEAEEHHDEPPTRKKQGARSKAKVVHETKRERLHRQRLQRIEEELAFLRDHESVPILPEEDEQDDASDGCASERSFMTTTSMLSTASTRSGVTRRQLDQFVAAEVTKAELDGGDERASRDEINKLLRSLSHLPITTARPATTTTV